MLAAVLRDAWAGGAVVNSRGGSLVVTVPRPRLPLLSKTSTLLRFAVLEEREYHHSNQPADSGTPCRWAGPFPDLTGTHKTPKMLKDLSQTVSYSSHGRVAAMTNSSGTFQHANNLVSCTPRSEGSEGLF